MASIALSTRFRVWALGRIDARCERAVSERKRVLLGDLDGQILELGPGRGASFSYFRSDIRWIGIEPDESCHAPLREAALARGIDATLLPAAGRSFDVPNASTDAVVSMFALCTVHDVADTLREVKRVLRPGGRFVFLEHVAASAGSLTLRSQRLVEPLWSRFADGCLLTRDTLPAIQEAGFSRVEYERFSISVPLLSPHVAGIATK